jgi:hypothetical protein
MARTCEQVRGDVCAESPRARRTSPKGALSLAALAGRGGHQGCDRVVFVFLGSWISLRFAFFTR